MATKAKTAADKVAMAWIDNILAKPCAKLYAEPQGRERAPRLVGLLGASSVIVPGSARLHDVEGNTWAIHDDAHSVEEVYVSALCQAKSAGIESVNHRGAIDVTSQTSIGERSAKASPEDYFADHLNCLVKSNKATRLGFADAYRKYMPPTTDESEKSKSKAKAGVKTHNYEPVVQ